MWAVVMGAESCALREVERCALLRALLCASWYRGCGDRIRWCGLDKGALKVLQYTVWGLHSTSA